MTDSGNNTGKNTSKNTNKNTNKNTSKFGLDDVDIQESRECYSGFLKVSQLQLRHRLFGGGWSGTVTREIVQRAAGVGVLLYDPELDKVLLVEQFRVGCLDSHRGPWKLELVAGLIDKDESPEQVAIRETGEEADIEIGHLLPVCNYCLSPGSSSEYMHTYCAGFDAAEVAAKPQQVFGLNEENEDIRTVLLSRAEADKAIVDGSIDNAMTIIALQWLGLNLGVVQEKLVNS